MLQLCQWHGCIVSLDISSDGVTSAYLSKNRDDEEVDEEGAGQSNGGLNAHIAQRTLLLLNLMMGNWPAVHDHCSA